MLSKIKHAKTRQNMGPCVATLIIKTAVYPYLILNV